MNVGDKVTSNMTGEVRTITGIGTMLVAVYILDNGEHVRADSFNEHWTCEQPSGNLAADKDEE